MKSVLFFVVACFLLIFNSCHSSSNQSKQSENKATKSEYFLLNADKFAFQLKKVKDKNIIDVRSQDEFDAGHIENATNINVNSEEFLESIQKLDKQKPTFVYCLSGGRSQQAVEKMKQLGFKKIYELDGGILSWRNANLPEVGQREQLQEISQSTYNQITDKPHLVLIDFHATWCGPCKKMAPFLEEIQEEYKGKLEIIKIDIDKNQALSSQLKIEAIPLLKLYQSGELVWNNLGFVTKDVITTQIDNYLK